jgi:subfamily B ATP-binding cassette protein MsbA
MRLFRRLIPIARPYKFHALGALLCILLATALNVVAVPLLIAGLFGTLAPAQPAVAAQGVAPAKAPSHGFSSRVEGWIKSFRSGLPMGAGTRGDRIRWLLIFGGLMAAAYLLKCLAEFGQTYLSQHLAQHFMGDLRQMVYDKLLRLPPAFYELRQTGDLMSRTISDVSLVQDLVSVQLADLVVAGVTIALGLGLMAVSDWQLTIFAVALVPLIGWIIARAGNRMRHVTREMQRRLARLNVRLQERLASIRIVQSFAREQFESETFRRINADAVEANLQAARIAAIMTPFIEFVGVAAMTGGIIFAGWQVIRQDLSAAFLIGVFYIVQQVGLQFAKLGRLNLALQRAVAAGQRVFEVLDSESEIADAPDAVPLPKVEGRVEFDDVSFRYASGEPVLREVRLQVEPGEVIALVGPSGAGKTSLVSLIPRFYDPTQGAIRVDGHDVRTVTLASLRGQIGIVPQETILFGGAVYDNILYGRPDASREEVIEAARAANADEFISALPQGYDTEVGERALKLSGGQRQRLAIARALLKDPRILILDEATSSLDTASEALVQEALDRLMRGRTTLVIAHRLSTIRNAHRILVLADGRIIEQGNHHELLARGGAYRRLYEMQFRQDDRPPEAADAA